MRRLRAWRFLLVLATGVVALAGVGERAFAQSADNGLEERSVNSFEFDPTRGVVRVTIDLALRNVTTDRVDGNVIRRAFFDGYSIAVPLGAENIIATRDGTAVAGSVVSDPDVPAFSTYRIPLDPPLFSGESATLQVTYDHVGAPPRNPVPWRVNEAYAGFLAFGMGDDGLITLQISQPFGYELDGFTDLTGFTTSEPDGFGTVVHTRAGLDDDTRITVGMANDARLVPRPLAVEGVDIELRSWPDDPEWADFAAAHVESGIPALEGLIGTAWPVEGSFVVRQTVEPNLEGYAGWFDAQSNEIAVGEALDADTIYHELSHAWFNRRLTTERWFTEGLAQVYAAELVRRDGGLARASIEPDPTDPNALPLADWSGLGSDRAVEQYGYAASFWVLDVLVDEIGLDRTREVVAALRDGTSVYEADQPGESPDEEWKRIYDAFVEVGGAVSADEVFGAFVVGADGAATIGVRDRAAADVAGLARRSEPWALPVGVRQRLERWEFGEVADGVIGADAVLERRSELASIEEAVGVDEPDRAGEAFAGAPARGAGVDFSEATAILDEAIELGERLVDVQQRVADVADDALVVPPDVAGLDGVADFATATAAAELQLAAVERLVEVDEQVDDTSGLLATIGRWGTDLDADIDEARAQVERGDNNAALATLAAVSDRLDGVETTGALRLAAAVASTVMLAVLMLLALTLIRRRRRRQPVAAALSRSERGT